MSIIGMGVFVLFLSCLTRWRFVHLWCCRRSLFSLTRVFSDCSSIAFCSCVGGTTGGSNTLALHIGQDGFDLDCSRQSICLKMHGEQKWWPHISVVTLILSLRTMPIDSVGRRGTVSRHIEHSTLGVMFGLMSFSCFLRLTLHIVCRAV
jgi:hypothetical protein